MTAPSINFPQPDDADQSEMLRTVLTNALRLTGFLPQTGLILKVRPDENGKEAIVNWTLANQHEIEMIAAGLSVIKSPPDIQPKKARRKRS